MESHPTIQLVVTLVIEHWFWRYDEGRAGWSPSILRGTPM